MQSRLRSEKIVHSHPGLHSVSVSVCSTAGLWASGRRYRELALRPQLTVYKRKRRRPVLTQWDRLSWVGLSQVWSRWRHALVFFQPDTVVRWQRERFHRFRARLSELKGSRRGRPAVAGEIRRLIRQR